MKRPALILSAVLLLASACSLGPRQDWADAIHDASKAAASSGAARVRVTTSIKVIETTIRVTPKPLFATLVGTADFTAHRGHVVAEQSGKVGLFFDGLQAWASRSKASIGKSDKPWARFDFAREPSVDIDANDRRDALGAAVISPTLASDLLEGVLTGSIKNLGSETIDGAAVTKYAARLSQDAAVRDIRDDTRREGTLRVFETLGIRDDVFPVDVWLDGQGRPREIRFVVKQQKDRVNTFRTVFDWKFSDYGTGGGIELPARTDVITSRRFNDFVSEIVREAV
jgi:hypothetical protein